MSRTKAVSMDSSLVGPLGFAAPEMFPLAPLIHRGGSARRSQHTGDGPMDPGGMAFLGGKNRKGALPSFGLSVFCTIVMPRGRSPNGTVDHLSRRPTLEDHFSKIRLTLPRRDSVQH
jgi:hypothetical protein